MANLLVRRPISIGILMAAVFVAADMMIPLYVGYETMVLGFSISLFFVCLALMNGPKDGLICGLTALVAYDAGEFARYAIKDGIAASFALLPYPLFLTLAFIIAGILGGYLGARLGSANSNARSEKLRRRGRP